MNINVKPLLILIKKVFKGGELKLFYIFIE